MAKRNKTSYDKAKLAAKLSLEKKGQDIVLLNLQGLSTICDWFVLVTASSERRIKTIAKSIDQGLSKEHFKLLHSEGKEGKKWALLDFGDVVIHIFHEDIRIYYDLENLWSEAPREKYKEKCSKKTSQKNYRQ